MSYVLLGHSVEFSDRDFELDGVLRFKSERTGMVLKLHKSDFNKFIQIQPNKILSYEGFSMSSTSNYIDEKEVRVITDFILQKCTKRKYNTVEELMKSKVRKKNKEKLLNSEYTTSELIEYIKERDNKKGDKHVKDESCS